MAQGEKQAFVIMPIGGKEQKNWGNIYTKFIRHAVETSGYNYRCIRADEVGKPGMIIKDILYKLKTSNLVIADLTSQNPNVFYELGVRHSLRNNTILISQNIEDIPFDLRSYRVITYEYTFDGIDEFVNKIHKTIQSIEEGSDEADSPIFDLLSNKENIPKKNRKETDPIKINHSISSRLSKILEFKSIQKVEDGDMDNFFESGTSLSYLTVSPFQLYYQSDSNINSVYFIADRVMSTNHSDCLRELSLIVKRLQSVHVKPDKINFIICDYFIDEHKIQVINDFFEDISCSHSNNIEINVWTEKKIIEIEKELGLIPHNYELLNDDNPLPF